MPFSNFVPSFIERRPGATFLSLLILVAGVFFVLRAPTSNDTVVQKWERPLKGGTETESGATVAYMTSSGSLTMSGLLKVGDNRTGSGTIKVGGSDGGGACFADQDGTGCTCADYNNGTQILRSGAAAECP